MGLMQAKPVVWRDDDGYRGVLGAGNDMTLHRRMRAWTNGSAAIAGREPLFALCQDIARKVLGRFCGRTDLVV